MHATENSSIYQLSSYGGRHIAGFQMALIFILETLRQFFESNVVKDKRLCCNKKVT